MFPNESRFTVTGDSNHRLLRTERGDYAQQCVCERDRYRSGMLVWAVCTMSEHRFTSLREAALFRSGVAERLF